MTVLFIGLHNNSEQYNSSHLLNPLDLSPVKKKDVPGPGQLGLCGVLPADPDIWSLADQHRVLPGLCGGWQDNEGILQSGLHCVYIIYIYALHVFDVQL